MNILCRLGGRKFIVAVLGVVAIAVGSLTGHDLKPDTIQWLAGIIASYCIGQGISDGLSGGATSSNPPEKK